MKKTTPTKPQTEPAGQMGGSPSPAQPQQSGGSRGAAAGRHRHPGSLHRLGQHLTFARRGRPLV